MYRRRILETRGGSSTGGVVEWFGMSLQGVGIGAVKVGLCCVLIVC